jgi:endo-1,4-beta-xylanase
MKVRGHVLVWNQSNPAWLTHGTFSSAQLSTILTQHIATVVGRYRGRIAQWDVVNEAFDDTGKLRQDVWGHALGVKYIAAAFTAAHRADPKAKLFYNDYNIEFPGPKADAVFAEVQKLRAQHVAIAGVGFQMHVLGHHAPAAPFPTVQQLAAQMRRYRKVGLEVAVTEFDERMPLPATSADLRAQGTEFEAALRACLSAPNCHTFNTWGFTDKYSWIPSWYPGYGAATMLNRSYGAKPAAAGLRAALAR